MMSELPLDQEKEHEFPPPPLNKLTSFFFPTALGAGTHYMLRVQY